MAEDTELDKTTEELCDSQQEILAEENPDIRQSAPIENHQKPRSESQASGKSGASAGFDVVDQAEGDNSQESNKRETLKHSNVSILPCFH